MNLTDITVSKKVLDDTLLHKDDIRKAFEKYTLECDNLESLLNAVFISGMAFQQVRMGGNTEILE